MAQKPNSLTWLPRPRAAPTWPSWISKRARRGIPRREFQPQEAYTWSLHHPDEPTRLVDAFKNQILSRSREFAKHRLEGAPHGAIASGTESVMGFDDDKESTR